ncbi:MAG: amidohydrolase family protein [Vicinamibacterales bacterium]
MRRWLPVIVALGVAGCARPPVPDLLIVNARVFTNDPARPWAEAVAVKGQRVVAVGESGALRQSAGDATRVIDAGGRVLVPGFNDARVDLPREPPTPAGLAALDRDAVASGVTSLQVIAGGPMASLVPAALQAERRARWRLIRSPEDTATLDTRDPTRVVRQDEEPFLPPQPGERLDASGIAWTLSGGASAERRPIAPSRVATVVGWAYGAEDPLIVLAGGGRDASRWLDALAKEGLPQVWQRKRPRLDLAMSVSAETLPRLRALGVVVTWLPSATRPARWSGPGFPPRFATTAASGAIADAGIPIAAGSAGAPAPMTSLDALSSAGRAMSGRPLSREDAVRAMTWGSAYAEKAERDKGWLGPGTLADLTVLSDDIFAAPAERLPAVASVLTVVGGTIVYDAGVLSR